MINMENILFVIPARSGSQGIKDKNIMMWKGKPLLMHTYDFLIERKINCENICISTDSKRYIDFFLNQGVNKKSFIKRPKCLGENFVVDYPVVLHSWAIKEEINKKIYDYIAIMRPTSPVRPNNIIESGLEVINNDRSLTSVRAMRKVKEHPNRVWKKNNLGFVEPLLNDTFEPGNLPRQKLVNDFFYQSGELEIIRRTTLQMGSVSGSKVGILEINEINIDIDTKDDLKY